MRLSRDPGRAVHQELRDEEIGRGDAPFHCKARLFCRRFQGGLIKSVYIFLDHSLGAERGRIALNRLFHHRNPIVRASVISDFIAEWDHLFFLGYTIAWFLLSAHEVLLQVVFSDVDQSPQTDAIMLPVPGWYLTGICTLCELSFI